MSNTTFAQSDIMSHPDPKVRRLLMESESTEDTSAVDWIATAVNRAWNRLKSVNISSPSIESLAGQIALQFDELMLNDNEGYDYKAALEIARREMDKK